MAFQLRREGGGSAPAPVADLSRAEVVGERPALAAHLTEDKWEDGSPRETSTLMVCFGEGRFRACLNDRAARRSVWVSGATPDLCFEALENGLHDGSLEWRETKWQGKRK